MKQLLIPLFFLFIFPGIAFGEKGDNCEMNLSSSIPSGQDWDGAYIIRDENGSAWQRTLLSHADDIIRLQEGEATDIRGTAQPNMPVEIYIFKAIDTPDGGLQKPDAATCFDAGIANEEGYFSLPINARMMWGSIGDEVVIDAFTKLDESWDQLTAAKTNETYLIGTHMAAKRFRVGVESEAVDCPKLCTTSSYTIGTRIRPKMYPAMARASFDNDESLELDLEGEEAQTGIEGTDGPLITIAKLAPNTFYTLADPNEPEMAQFVDGLAEKALLVEIIKRHLIGVTGVTGLPAGMNAPNILPANLHYLEEINDESLGVALAAKNVSPEITTLVNNLHDALTSPQGTQTRIQAIVGIQKAFFAMMPDDRTGYTYPDIKMFDEVFPSSRQELSWRADLIDIFKLWTEDLKPNRCLMPEANIEDNFKTPPVTLLSAPIPETNCSAALQNRPAVGTADPGNTRNRFFSARISGKDPVIVVNEEIKTLKPVFSSIIITRSNLSFHSADSWNIPRKQPFIEYKYLPSTPFIPETVNTTCVTDDGIKSYAAALSKEIGLPDTATKLIIREITGNLPQHANTLSLKLADPREIAKRIRWQANGQNFDIRQLFFRIEAKDCTPTLSIPLANDILQYLKTKDTRGYEIGIF